MRPFRVELILSDDDAGIVVRALAALGEPTADDLARRVSRAIAFDRQQHESQVAAEKALADLRAERAKEATLTPRQAEAMAAMRSGHAPTQTFESTWGNSPARWTVSRSRMGGAVWRMVERLREEGLVVPDRWKLTDAGAERLREWEARNVGKFAWPVPEAEGAA